MKVRHMALIEADFVTVLDGIEAWRDDIAAHHGELHVDIELLGLTIGAPAKVTLGGAQRMTGLAVVPLRLRAARHRALFPVLDAGLEIRSLEPDLSEVALEGSYRAPFGLPGALADRLGLHAVAEKSLKRFLDRLMGVVGAVVRARSADDVAPI